MLSRRGQGDTGEGDEGESVVSNLQGRFAMRDGAIQVSELTFAIPGAIVRLAGGYYLRTEIIDFTRLAGPDFDSVHVRRAHKPLC